MSIRQPVSRAARRAFWPSLPIASDSWKSGTTTRAERASASTTSTEVTRAGESAWATSSAGSSDQSTMSIFSPCSSDITLRTRWPIGPMQAPLALTPGRVGLHRDLGAVAGLAGDRRDLDGAVGDLGHLEGEQLLDQVGVRAGQRDLRAAHALAHREDQALDPGAVLVLLPRHPLGHRQHRLELAEVDHHVVGVAALLDDAGDDVALLAGELAVADVVLGVAQPLQHDLLRGRRGDPAEALGRVVELAELVALLVDLGGEHGDVAGLAVQHRRGRAPAAPGRLLVRRQQGLLDGLDEHVEGDLLLALQDAQDAQVDVHQASSAVWRSCG